MFRVRGNEIRRGVVLQLSVTVYNSVLSDYYIPYFVYISNNLCYSIYVSLNHLKVRLFYVYVQDQ